MISLMQQNMQIKLHMGFPTGIVTEICSALAVLLKMAAQQLDFANSRATMSSCHEVEAITNVMRYCPQGPLHSDTT